MVKKLLQQRKRTGQIGARHAYSGRKPLIVQAHDDQMRVLLGQKPDMTLKELREALGLDYSPDLNPIEKMWSKLKEILRSVEARSKPSLIEAIASALEAITVQDAINWFVSCGYSFI